MSENRFQIQFPVRTWQDTEADCFVSHLEKLDLYSAGKTEEEALESIKSAMTLYFLVASQKDTLRSILVDRGILDTGERKDPLTITSSARPNRKTLLSAPMELALAY